MDQPAIDDLGRPPCRMVGLDEIVEYLNRAAAMGFDLSVGSKIEDLTISELIMIVNTRSES